MGPAYSTRARPRQPGGSRYSQTFNSVVYLPGTLFRRRDARGVSKLQFLCGSSVEEVFVNTIPYHTIPCNAIPYHTIPYHTIPYHIIPYHIIPCPLQRTESVYLLNLALSPILRFASPLMLSNIQIYHVVSPAFHRRGGAKPYREHERASQIWYDENICLRQGLSRKVTSCGMCSGQGCSSMAKLRLFSPLLRIAAQSI